MITQNIQTKIATLFHSKSFITAEFIILCLLVPGFIIVNKLAPMMFYFLWAAALYAFLVLRRSYFGSITEMWKWSAVTWEAMKPILVRWVLASIGMVIFIYFYDPDRMFNIIIDHPKLALALIFLYPVFSALPQEIVFCSFFFERYKTLFGTGMKMVLASTIVFAYAHILYINPVAPTLSLLGGYIFATTYWKSRSLALVTIEHGLYGNSLFLIGLGWYFYGGAVQ